LPYIPHTTTYIRCYWDDYAKLLLGIVDNYHNRRNKKSIKIYLIDDRDVWVVVVGYCNISGLRCSSSHQNTYYVLISSWLSNFVFLASFFSCYSLSTCIGNVVWVNLRHARYLGFMDSYYNRKAPLDIYCGWHRCMKLLIVA